MSVFKKINRGLVVLLALIIGVVGYLVALHFIRQADREEIKDLAADYLSVLQEDLRLGNRTAEQALQESAESQEKFFASATALEPTLLQLEYYYEQQQAYGTIEELTIDVIKANSFVFDGNTATATITADITYAGNEFIIYTAQKTNYRTTTDFVFEKTEDGWKLFYYDVDLDYNVYG